MFSQRRKKYKNMVWASVLIAVVLLALVMLLGYLGRFSDRDYEQNVVNETVTVPQESQSEETVTETDRSFEETVSENKKVEQTKKETYYIVKYDNDVIRVYFSDQQGTLTELEETDIVYETLSVEDQARLQEGIQVANRDALNRLLMDYES